jgi:hypothetical protein
MDFAKDPLSEDDLMNELANAPGEFNLATASLDELTAQIGKRVTSNNGQN